MPTNLAQAPDYSVEPTPAEFAAYVEEVAAVVAASEQVIAGLVASRAAARGRP